MKKIIASVAFIAAFAGYALFLQSTNTANANVSSAGTEAPSVAAQVQPEQVASQTSSGTTGSTHTTVTQATTPIDKPKGQFTDGTYTGTSENAFYGYVQVRATVSGGKLTDVTILSYPNDRHDSVEINQQALPVLKQEAIAAQSANVDGVSGATDTSDAFVRSLSNALEQAKA
jgi:uncharacterized protein with FMN-binding domain